MTRGASCVRGGLDEVHVEVDTVCRNLAWLAQQVAVVGGCQVGLKKVPHTLWHLKLHPVHQVSQAAIKSCCRESPNCVIRELI